ncbi:hypothetical protein BAC2_00038 [uncultured bacterium]|nr:hypothetical protein BAC2_00038 [uncultured bacterium]
MLAARRAALARRLRTVRQLAGGAVIGFFATIWVGLTSKKQNESIVGGLIELGFLVLLFAAAAGLGLWAWWLSSGLRDLDAQIEADKQSRTSLADIFKREP